jgi:hypothetical protein
VALPGGTGLARCHGMRNLKFPLLLAAFGLLNAFTSTANAGYAGYDIHWPKKINEYFQYLNRTLDTAPAPQLKCEGAYQRAFSRNRFVLNYALGYFDESAANQIYLTNPNFPISVALDGIAFDVIRSVATQPCDSSTKQKFCGFSESGNAEAGKVSLTKSVEIYGRTVAFEINLTKASASESFRANQSSLLPVQQTLTAQGEQNFFSALGSSEVDAVFYNGHSRDGGGPDFAPPILRDSDLHPNYALYQARQTGIKKMLSQMSGGRASSQIVGMFSCYTRRHFQKRLLAASPKQRLILSEDKVNYMDTIIASLGYIEGIMQGQCGQTLETIVGQSPLIRDGFTTSNY